MAESTSKGKNRSKGVSWQQLLATDARPAPDWLVDESYTYRGSEPLEASRYTSAEFEKLENERVWPNVWQFAAREEDMPDTGDFVVYENAGRSFLVVRQADGGVRAFHNVCLHRGRKLRTENGSADQFQCPFHGFTWSLAGDFKDVPCRWDFTHLKDAEMKLPEAGVGRWAGYIFVRENSGGPSLLEYLAPLPAHFARWRHEECFTAINVGKVVPANWKVTMEAFMEAWHTIVTHPQLLPFTGDENGAYQTWGDHVNANLVPLVLPCAVVVSIRVVSVQRSPTLAVGRGLVKSTVMAPIRFTTGNDIADGLGSPTIFPSFTKKWKKTPFGTVVISGPSIAIASPPSMPAESTVMWATWPPALSVSVNVIRPVVVTSTV